MGTPGYCIIVINNKIVWVQYQFMDAYLTCLGTEVLNAVKELQTNLPAINLGHTTAAKLILDLLIGRMQNTHCKQQLEDIPLGADPLNLWGFYSAKFNGETLANNGSEHKYAIYVDIINGEKAEINIGYTNVSSSWRPKDSDNPFNPPNDFNSPTQIVNARFSVECFEELVEAGCWEDATPLHTKLFRSALGWQNTKEIIPFDLPVPVKPTGTEKRKRDDTSSSSSNRKQAKTETTGK